MGRVGAGGSRGKLGIWVDAQWWQFTWCKHPGGHSACPGPAAAPPLGPVSARGHSFREGRAQLVLITDRGPHAVPSGSLRGRQAALAEHLLSSSSKPHARPPTPMAGLPSLLPSDGGGPGRGHGSDPAALGVIHCVSHRSGGRVLTRRGTSLGLKPGWALSINIRGAHPAGSPSGGGFLW